MIIDDLRRDTDDPERNTSVAPYSAESFSPAYSIFHASQSVVGAGVPISTVSRRLLRPASSLEHSCKIRRLRNCSEDCSRKRRILAETPEPSKERRHSL